MYAVYGSKARLALALIDAGEADADPARTSADLDAASGDPAGQLAAMVASDRRLFERAGDVYRVLTEERGWTPEQVERWWDESLARLLLRQP